jgi:hypothetical protein
LLGEFYGVSTILEQKRKHLPMSRCPYCDGDLDAYRKARRTRLRRKRLVHRGVEIEFLRQPGGISFTLNGRRYVDRRRFLDQGAAIETATAMIDELLDSAKVQALDDE